MPSASFGKARLVPRSSRLANRTHASTTKQWTGYDSNAANERERKVEQVEVLHKGAMAP